MIEQNLLEQMLAGKMAMCTFTSLLRTNDRLQMYVRDLIPSEAINSGQHDFWKRISYDAFRRNQFDFIKFLYSLCRFDESVGDNLNIFSFMKNVYTYSHPDFKCTTLYQEAFDLYLDVVKDCYDGPEVRHIVDQIIHEALLRKTKKEKIQFANDSISSKFHLAGKKRPRWIQGAEWPMGMYSPMEFVSQCRSTESVQYQFIDVDTKEVRFVEQFY